MSNDLHYVNTALNNSVWSHGVYLSSWLSTWKVRSITEVHCRQRMTNVLGRGRSVFISWHSGGQKTPKKPTRGLSTTNTTLTNLCGTCITCDREVVEWGQTVITHFRFLFVTNKGTVTLQDEVSRTPCFNVFTYRRSNDIFSKWINWRQHKMQNAMATSISTFNVWCKSFM